MRSRWGARDITRLEQGAAAHGPHTPPPPPHPAPPLPLLSPHSYNERFLALRDLKRRMLDHMHEEEGRLAEINAELGAPPPVPPPTSLEPEEEPERRMDVTDADIDEFTAKLEKEKATKGYGTDFGGLAATPAKGGAVAESPRAAAAAAPAAPSDGDGGGDAGAAGARGSSTSGPPCSTSARGRWRRSTAPSPSSALRSCGSRPT